MLKAELGPTAPGPLHHCQAEDHGVRLFLLGWSPLPSPRSPSHTPGPIPRGIRCSFWWPGTLQGVGVQALVFLSFRCGACTAVPGPGLGAPCIGKCRPALPV